MDVTDQDDATFAYRCVCGDGMHIHPVYSGRMVVCVRCKRPVIVPEKVGDAAIELVVRLRSERLEIAPAEPRDWKGIITFSADPGNYLYEVSEPDTPRTLRKSLRTHRFPQGFCRNKRLNLLVRRIDRSDPIGLVSLQLDPSHLTAVLGILLHHPFHNQGFGTEALQAVLRFAFGTVGIHRISAMCDTMNEPCVKMLRKAGFVQEGVMKEWFHHPRRGWIDSPMFAAFGPDFVAEGSSLPHLSP
jgi:RimJ/RimL family protein N-acetyltransferase